MKKLPITLLILALLWGIVACNKSEDYWTQYEKWRDDNNAWFTEQLIAKDEHGNNVYTKVTPTWDQSVYILMKHYNDTTLNRDSLSPYQTSTVDVMYKGMLYNGTPFDSSYTATDSIYRIQVKNTIKGWIIALEHMRIGDSCRVIIPQDLAYGGQYVSSTILPYSALIFDMKLVGIPGLDKPVR